MMSLATIHELERESGKRAAQKAKMPYVPIHEDEIETYPPFPFPNLGDHRPKGWELVEELFCDSSGWGAPDEQALSVDQLKRKLVELQRASDGTYGYGITQIGQFQLYLGVFKRRKYRSLGDKLGKEK